MSLHTSKQSISETGDLDSENDHNEKRSYMSLPLFVTYQQPESRFGRRFLDAAGETSWINKLKGYISIKFTMRKP